MRFPPVEFTLCLLLLCAFAVSAFASQDAPAPASQGASMPAPTPAAYRQIADEVEANFKTHVLTKWFPAAVDRTTGGMGGGFYQNFREDWTRDPLGDKSIVYQSRLTWVAAQAALRYPAEAGTYQEYARHGLAFLDDHLWDTQNGGFFWGLEPGGAPQRGGEKHVYGVAFGIYAACACYQATHDERALALAKRAYAWIEIHAHDKAHGGYYEALSRMGRPILAPASNASDAQNDFIGTHYGYKSMNTHIHVLEALTALVEIWPDAGLKKRAQEIFGLVRDRIAVAPGCMNLFYTPDWRPIPDHDSFGHDVETAFLLTESASVLGKPNDAPTWTIARMLVDHALEYGWDAERGGFYDTGTAFGPPVVTEKIWWTQGEGLNALALMHARYGKETAKYWEAFNRQWQWIQKYQIDKRYGGWYPTVKADGTPPPGHVKSDQWTEAYHQGRALLLVSEELRRLADGANGHAAPPAR